MNNMEAESGSGGASTAEILRGIVVEKLTTAAQEILAAVERSVSGYEEEAAGLRRQLERQRRQLEALLQPRVKLERREEPLSEPLSEPTRASEEPQQHKQEPNDQLPVSCEPAGGAELPEEQQEPSVEDLDLGLICYTQVRPEEEEEDRQRLTQPDYEEASRLLTPTVQSDRRSAGRPQISETQNHIDLRVRVLEDSQIEVLSLDVYRKYPVQELRCPRGLQEADFLELLSSTFPQLAAHRPFDVFLTDRTKRLQPLRVKTLTPEEVHRSISSTGYSALYIRLKNTSSENKAAALQTQETFHPSQRKDAAASPSAPDQTSLSPRVESDRRTSDRHQISDTQSHLDLRICILEDSQIDMLSANLYRKYPVQELQCPRGLQEADFLELLSSTFPQLAAHKPFDVFLTDRTKRLQPLRVKTLTPEEVQRSIRLTGAGNSALYIRLKAPEEVQAREEEPLPRKNAAPDSPSTDQSRRVQSDRRSFSRTRMSEPRNHVDLRICILEDSRIDVLSANVYKKYAVHELQCPCGLQEADFLELLSSTFPQLAAHKPFDVFLTDRTKRLQPLRVKTLTPEEVQRSISSTGYSALYIRLKAQEEVQSSEVELHRADAVKDSSSASDQTRLNRSFHNSPVEEVEGDKTDHLSSSSRQRQQMETEEEQRGASDDFSALSSADCAAESEGASRDDDDVEEEDDRDDDWKPDEPDEELRESEAEPNTKTTRKLPAEPSGVRRKRRKWIQSSAKASTDDGDAPLSCKVCRALRGSTSMLTKHAWSHVDDPERLCGVCGEHSESAEELRNHLQRHQRTHSCNICGKSFLSVSGFNGHVARHKGTKAYKCKICHKAFPQKRVHEADKPHKCDLYPKACASKVELERHKLSHTGEGLHHCNVCGKTLSSADIFSKHMRHCGDTTRQTTFTCDICSKTFNTHQKLRVHMSVHSEKKCSVCHMVFSHSRFVRRHMKTHQKGSDVSVRILSRVNGTRSVRRVR